MNAGRHLQKSISITKAEFRQKKCVLCIEDSSIWAIQIFFIRFKRKEETNRWKKFKKKYTTTFESK